MYNLDIYMHIRPYTQSGVFICVQNLAVYHYNRYFEGNNRYFEGNIFIDVYIPPPSRDKVK